MKESILAGLILANRIKESSIVKLPNIARYIGPVKSSSYRQSSRISNALRAGFPVYLFEDLSNCQVILICTSADKLPAILNELRTVSFSWTEKVVLLCGGPHNSENLAGLAERGASVGSLNVIEGPDTSHFLIEGDKFAMHMAKKLIVGSGGQVMEVGRDTQLVCTAGASFASWLLMSLLEASALCLRKAGMTPGRARMIIERIVQRSLRAYLKGGKRAWKGPVTAQHQQVFLRQMESLQKTDPELAVFLAETAKLSIRQFGLDTMWLENASRSNAAGAGS